MGSWGWFSDYECDRMDDSAPESIALPDRRNAAAQQNSLEKCEAKQAFSAE
jgi:hypothetical protein